MMGMCVRACVFFVSFGMLQDQRNATLLCIYPLLLVVFRNFIDVEIKMSDLSAVIWNIIGIFLCMENNGKTNLFQQLTIKISWQTI